MTKRCEEFDHSGDIGVAAQGTTRAELFEAATAGLCRLMTESPVATRVQRTLAVTSGDAAALLVDWLGEVISAAAMHAEVYGDVRMSHVGETRAEGVVVGERVDATRHHLRFDVKAATYHRLEFREDVDGFHARVVFDL